MIDLEAEFQKLIISLSNVIKTKEIAGELSPEDAIRLQEMVQERLGNVVVAIPETYGEKAGWSESSIECGYQNEPIIDYWSSSTIECIEAAKAYDTMCEEQDKSK